jgi:phosphonate transport system ATP-binding protein
VAAETALELSPAFELTKASAGYGGRRVLTDIDLVIQYGECVALMGKSGAGKSTLLNLLFEQRPADIALVPQATALVKPLSVFHNVYMGRLDRRTTWANLRTLVWPKAFDVAEISDVLASVGMADKIFAQAGALSGGQQQRTSVARALYNGRPILLGDEPVSALDRVQGAEIVALLKQRHPTVVVIMHDVALALEQCDRIVVLDHGRIVIDARSASLTVKDLMGLFEAKP